MLTNKLLTAAAILLFIPVVLFSQNTNTPYSRNGFGSLDIPALGKSKAMGGITIGVRENNMINLANPASYSAVDTMNLLFDFGVSGTYYSFKEDNVKAGNPNGGLDYVAMKIPLKRYWGLALGLAPYSKVGYSYSEIDYLTGVGTYANTYAGSGGLNTMYIGTSVSLWDKLSLGVNYKYTFGTITQSSSLTFYDTDINSKSPTEYWYLNNSSFDLGLQFDQKIGSKNRLVLGAVYSAKTKVNNEIYKIDVTTDTIETTSASDFQFPSSLGAGLSWTYDDRLTFGIDYQTQSWSKALFYGVSDTLSNNNRLSLGMEYLPKLMANKYFEAVKYRFGMYYNDSYMKFPQGNIKNIGLTMGLGLPLRGQRSALNIAFEAGKTLTPNASFISENYYKLSLDISFNEVWFFKRKL